MLSKCVGGALSGHRVKLATAIRTAATASRTDGGQAVSWRKGEENVKTVPHVRYTTGNGYNIIWILHQIIIIILK